MLAEAGNVDRNHSAQKVALRPSPETATVVLLGLSIGFVMNRTDGVMATLSSSWNR